MGGGNKNNKKRPAGGGAKKGPQLLEVKYVGRDQAPSDTIYVSGLPAKMNKEMVKNMFTDQGFAVQEVWHTPDKFGSGYCVASVQVGSKEEAAMAIDVFTGQLIEIAEDP